jgi:hypothetical protein
MHTLLPTKCGLSNKALVKGCVNELEQQALLRAVGGAGVVAAEVGVSDSREELHLRVELLLVPFAGAYSEHLHRADFAENGGLVHDAAAAVANAIRIVKLDVVEVDPAAGRC